MIILKVKLEYWLPGISTGASGARSSLNRNGNRNRNGNTTGKEKDEVGEWLLETIPYILMCLIVSLLFCWLS